VNKPLSLGSAAAWIAAGTVAYVAWRQSSTPPAETFSDKEVRQFNKERKAYVDKEEELKKKRESQS